MAEVMMYNNWLFFCEDRKTSQISFAPVLISYLPLGCNVWNQFQTNLSSNILAILFIRDAGLFPDSLVFRSSNWTSGAKHEAGFDAFMTGCLFAQECAHLGIKFDLSLPLTNLAANEKLKDYINLLYPSWNSGIVIDLTTGIEKPESNYKRKYPTVLFSNIVLLWGFLSKFKPKDLKDCITKVFGAS